MRDQFLLDNKTIFLNHGSFGASPKIVFSDYQQWQRQLELNPVQFIVNDGPKYLEQSKKSLSVYINAPIEDLIFTPNPSTALNIVIKNLRLQPGDEILSTDHEYGAMNNTWNYYTTKTGAHYIQQNISTPIVSKEEFLREFWAGLTKKTKVIFISHITSASGMIFPVKEICEKAKSLGLLTIIDGAHVPGHIPLDIQQLDADVYAGACHKWMLAPKGSSFLYVRKELQQNIDPLVISWGYSVPFDENSFQAYHQFQGTNDFSAYLSVRKSIEFISSPNWIKQQDVCKQQIRHYYPILAKELSTEPICPVNDHFLGQMCSVLINTDQPEELKILLYQDFHIEIPITNLLKDNYLRLSYQTYNTERDVEYLIDALRKIKKETTLIH
jgi:isopenicillin-N epimerase